MSEGMRAARPRRICFVIDRLAGRSGGAERILIETANALAARGHEVQIVSHETREGAPFYPLAFGVIHTNLRRPKAVRSRLRRRIDQLREIAAPRAAELRLPARPPALAQQARRLLAPARAASRGASAGRGHRLPAAGDHRARHGAAAAPAAAGRLAAQRARAGSDQLGALGSEPRRPAAAHGRPRAHGRDHRAAAGVPRLVPRAAAQPGRRSCRTRSGRCRWPGSAAARGRTSCCRSAGSRR